MWSDVKAALETTKPEGEASEFVELLAVTDLGIVKRTATLKKEVELKIGDKCQPQVVIATAALCLYRLRLSDISMSEHVLLIWITLGNVWIRCHEKAPYFYQAELGAWERYQGVFPDFVYIALKEILLQVCLLYTSTSPRD